MKKIVSIIGTRPEFIKIAALASNLNIFFRHIIIHSGQHYDFEMSKSFFGELSIPEPDYNLGVKESTQAAQVGKMMISLEKVLVKESPELVIVYGDTNTTLAGNLAAVKLKIPVAHVEAGMRSYDRQMPEEINRVIIDHVSTLFFCPSKIAVDNLAAEGITKNVFFTGDVMYDIFLKVKPDLSVLQKLKLKPQNYYFATIHRAENTNDLKRLKKLFIALDSLDKQVVIPVHPRSKKALFKLKLNLKNMKLINPIKFTQSLGLQKQAKAVITDSGGIQKEAYWLKVPCFTLRNTTEWPETVQSGWNLLVLNRLKELPNLIKSFKRPDKHPNFYGVGNASSAIVKIMEKLI